MTITETVIINPEMTFWNVKGQFYRVILFVKIRNIPIVIHS